MTASADLEPRRTAHSIPKRRVAITDDRGSVQLIVSVMLAHAGYDPVR